jgi:hypothetical protein
MGPSVSIVISALTRCASIKYGALPGASLAAALSKTASAFDIIPSLQLFLFIRFQMAGLRKAYLDG